MTNSKQTKEYRLTTRLALHPDGTPMISIGKAVPIDQWEKLASDPDHSRKCMNQTTDQPTSEND